MKRSKMPKWTVKLGLSDKSVSNKKQQFEYADTSTSSVSVSQKILSRNEVAGDFCGILLILASALFPVN